MDFQVVLKQYGYPHLKKSESWPFPHIIHKKNNFQWCIDMNINAENHKDVRCKHRRISLVFGSQQIIFRQEQSQ